MRSKNRPREFVLTYSAGIDSSILAELLRQQLGEVSLLTIGRLESSDVRMASQDPLARSNGFRFVLENIDVKAIEEAAIQVSKMVTVSSLSHFEDCVSFGSLLQRENKSRISITFYRPTVRTNFSADMIDFAE